MFKFFRNIRHALIQTRNGKPTSPIGRYLFYAVGEILLVVLGILIALKVNNWNNRLNEKISIGFMPLVSLFQIYHIAIACPLSLKGAALNLAK